MLPKFYLVWITLFTVLFNGNTLARNEQNFSFSIGDNINVISDKAFRRTKDNVFEAIGNVIITHRNNAIYCEKATLHFNTGEMNAVGNVRYVGDAMTMYGSRLDYNLNSGYFSAENARILGGDYVILGKKLSRISPEVIIGEDAEYTTCRDCPESWSLFGRNVHITMNEYIRIKHAYLKIKGIITTYIPYVVFPIKKEREIGLLFPKFGYQFNEGFHFQQPWFMPIGQSADVTLTPSFLGRRGFGNDFQVRHNVREGLWYEANSFQVLDKIYRPGSNSDLESGTTFYRNLSNWEHHFFSGKNFNHHTYINGQNDLDMVYDMERLIDDRVETVDTGVESFFDFRHNWFSLSAETYFQRNGLFENPKGFDHRYVQVLPKLSFNSIPIHLYQSKNMLMNRISFMANADHTTFKQNRVEEGEYIRNAQRLNATPELDLNLATLGALNIRTNIKFDYQHYRFPTEELQKSFSKSGLIYETEASFAIEKIFGLAYEEEIPVEELKVEKKEEQSTKKELIGSLPDNSNKVTGEKFRFVRNSFRHLQEYKFKHYLISDQTAFGNERFRRQINAPEEGTFDDLDALRDQQINLNSRQARRDIPLTNTLEFQWNNSLVRKTPSRDNLLTDGKSVRDNFNYDNVGIFNISQGIYENLNEDGETEYLLTRLLINARMNMPNSSISLTEYYFYYSQDHQFFLNYQKNFDYFNVSLGINYDGINTPIEKTAIFGTQVDLFERFRVSALTNYDYDEQRIQQTRYEVMYMPYNNCWRFNITYSRNLREKQVAFNFLINYNKNSFGNSGN